MRRTAMALVLLAVVAGCGQGGRPYTPQGAASPPERATGESTPEQPAQSTPEQPADEAPSGTETVEIGDGWRMLVEWPADPDPALKPMVDQFIGSRRAVAEGRRFYRTGLEPDAAIKASAWVQSFVDEGLTMRGVERLYNLRVAARMGRGAQVDVCVDARKAQLVSARTGKAVEPQPGWVRTPFPQSAGVLRGGDGVWRLRFFATARERCPR